MGAIIEASLENTTCCNGTQGPSDYSSGITLSSSQVGSLHSSQAEVFAVSRGHRALPGHLSPGCSLSLQWLSPLLKSLTPFSSPSRSITFSGKVFMMCWVPFSRRLCLSVYLGNGFISLHTVWSITSPTPSLICQLLQGRVAFPFQSPTLSSVEHIVGVQNTVAFIMQFLLLWGTHSL